MVQTHEGRVSVLANRVGLVLARTSESSRAIGYHLVEPQAGIRVFPGGLGEGASLSELEEWLAFPWE